MIQSPIIKVLSTIRKHGVKALLMGGQACVFYGAAEFSKDIDIILLAEPENLERLRGALGELEARQVYVPGLEIEALRRGHGVHFKCEHPDARGIRINVMSKLRGLDSFEKLWERRTTIEDRAGNIYDLVGLDDLVLAKKTQRAKDWPMLARLLEANYVEQRANPSEKQISFWLREFRMASYLIAVANAHPDLAREQVNHRPLLAFALAQDFASLETALLEEERAERERDRAYWQSLKRELEQMRRGPPE
ncbi:MAG: hypothetical protein H0W66_05855 [Chthoniobacterales bacterium]|nr:hypothetical protein [Chthoniobacterales bacterium]